LGRLNSAQNGAAAEQRLNTGIKKRYADRLDGRITAISSTKPSATWRSEQDAIQCQIHDIQRATPAPVDEPVNIMQLASKASELFLLNRPPRSGARSSPLQSLKAVGGMKS